MSESTLAERRRALTGAAPPRLPRREERRSGCVRWWLDGLDAEECLLRWPHQGAAGFYAHERTYLLDFTQHPEVRARAQRERAERDRRRAEVEAAKHGADLEAARHARTALEGLQTETPGTVADAALRASQLYMNERVPRSLKQCIAIAASERLVAWQGIQGYLAGVGARVLWARIDPGAVWYPSSPGTAPPSGEDQGP